MSNAPRLRPRLILNDQFMRALQTASAPCGDLGLLEKRGSSASFLAIRLREPLVPRLGTRALSFGHASIGEPGSEVLQFGVTFFESSTYHLLVNPGSPVVQAVMNRILETGYYFVFVINPDRWTTVFRADLDPDDLMRLADHRWRWGSSKTSAAQYRWTVVRFARNPVPRGELLEWVRGNADYLDFTQHRLELNSVH
jgi:hypothetical protein